MLYLLYNFRIILATGSVSRRCGQNRNSYSSQSDRIIAWYQRSVCDIRRGRVRPTERRDNTTLVLPEKNHRLLKRSGFDRKRTVTRITRTRWQWITPFPLFLSSLHSPSLLPFFPSSPFPSPFSLPVFLPSGMFRIFEEGTIPVSFFFPSPPLRLRNSPLKSSYLVWGTL